MAIQRELSNQEELVHQLDPEPVFDYLLQHRALDQSTVEVIRGEEKLADRNIKLLQHLEELGNPAVELFINALRQSGQLHLASSLDVEHRIKPVYGKGYWEKQRYKGQITISFQLVAAKVMVRKDSDEDQSPKIVDINAMLTPFKVKHSYENMILLEDEEGGPKARKILEYSYEEDNDERSCCLCCIPFLCCVSNSRKKKKQEAEKSANSTNVPSRNGAQLEKSSSDVSLNFCDVMVSLPSQPASPIKSGSTFFKTRKLSPTSEVVSDLGSPVTPMSKSESVDRNSNHHLNEAVVNTSPVSENRDIDVVFSAKEEDVSFKSTKSEKEKAKKKNSGKKKNKSDSMLEIKNQKNGHVTSNVKGGVGSENKENNDPLIMDIHENKLKDLKGKNRPPKLSPPKSLKTGKSPKGMTRSETYELVERWKSEGYAYQTARDQFFSYFDNSVQSRIVRYFEQERSTLVLQISADDKMAVCTICMTTKEVRKLREDYELGVLHEELVLCVDPQNIIDKMECCAIHLRTVIDDQDFTLSYQELS